MRRQRDGPLLWGEPFYFLLGFSSCPCFGCCCFISRPEYVKLGGACLCGVGLGALGLQSSFILGRLAGHMDSIIPFGAAGPLVPHLRPGRCAGGYMLLLPVARCSRVHGGKPAGRKAPMASPGPCQCRPVSAVQRAPPGRPKPGAPASCLYWGTALHALEPQLRHLKEEDVTRGAGRWLLCVAVASGSWVFGGHTRELLSPTAPGFSLTRDHFWIILWRCGACAEDSRLDKCPSSKELSCYNSLGEHTLWFHCGDTPIATQLVGGCSHRGKGERQQNSFWLGQG